MKKLAMLAGGAALITALAFPSAAEEGLVKVGGHMKGPVLTDNVWGKAMVNGVKSSGGYSAGSYFSTHAFQLYVSKDITENVSVQAVPDFGSAGAGATPSIGKKMGETLKDSSSYSSSGATSFKFQELTASMNVPSVGVQLKAGYMSLPFTQDYGKELFWHEEHNGGKFTLASSWHDTGLELYKAFEFAGISMPASVYVVNGNSSHNRDNNNSRAVMFHVEPEFGGLKTFGSFGTGKWGDAVVLSSGTLINDPAYDGRKNKTFYRWSAGVGYGYKAFKARAEVAGGQWDDYLYAGKSYEKNRKDFGYYGKLFYTVVPEKLTAMLHYNYYVNDVTASATSNYVISEKYDTTYLGLQYEVAPAATFLVGYTNGNWRNNDTPLKKDYVKFQRFQTSVKVTF